MSSSTIATESGRGMTIEAMENNSGVGGRSSSPAVMNMEVVPETAYIMISKHSPSICAFQFHTGTITTAVTGSVLRVGSSRL